MKLKKGGFSLLELILVLGVGTMITFIKFQDMRNEQENVVASAVGQQIRQIGDAVNGYINIRYDKLSTLTSSSSQSTDPGPRTCNASGCEITVATLVNEGLLPTTYKDTNSFRSPYKIIFKRSGTSPNYLINGLITTSAAWIEGGAIRYDLLGKAMQSAGIDSGVSKSATSVSGYNSQWTENSTNFNNITRDGLLAYRTGFNSAMYSVYLRRDGTLPMTGNLNMGGQSINNAKDITAAGNLSIGGSTTLQGALQVNNNINSTGAITAGNWVWAKNGYGDVIGLGGDAGANDYEIKMMHDKPLSIHMNSNRGDLNTVNITGGVYASGNGTIGGALSTGGNITAGGQIIGHNGGGDTYVIGGGDANDYEFRLGSNKPLTLWRSGGLSNEQRFQVWGRQDNLGDLSVRGDGNSSGSITASGNISSGGRLTSGEFVQINGVATAGAGCSPNGLQGRDAAGSILSCVSGVWASAGIGEVIRTNGPSRCGGDGRLPSYANCPAGYKLTGGGYALSQWRDDDGRNAPDTSYPDVVNNRFIVNPPGGNDAGCFTAYAICVR